MSSHCFTWLHLTDLHAGMDESEWLWPGVEEELLLDLGRMHERVGHIDAVFFTGDLTRMGTEEEFKRFDAVWGVVRSDLERLGSKPVFIAVPGNHDLVRPAKGSAVLDGLGQWTSNAELRRRFWREDNGDYRKVLTSAQTCTNSVNTAFSASSVNRAGPSSLSRSYGGYAPGPP